MKMSRLREFLNNQGVVVNPEDCMDTELDGCDWWDSMAILSTMVGAEQDLKISISGNELLGLKTIRDLCQLLFDRPAVD